MWKPEAILARKNGLANTKNGQNRDTGGQGGYNSETRMKKRRHRAEFARHRRLCSEV
ncbi:hypothetical protein [Mangrovibacter phragmitis]|uniref:hypothetical protein n=1 Tax=Mangrovibacter phragmitis TaxID=1691903 RepID=UPI00336A4E94